jgi:hypothetical protein
MLTDELLTYLFDGQPHLLRASIAAWLASSRRFNTFADTFRDKIRKKLRVTQDPETLLDLQLELETAYLLLQERPFSVVYEPQQCGQGRCPDFAVSYTTSLTFMVEVTRMRATRKGTSKPASEDASFSLEGDRLADAVCSKLGQLPPQSSNILILGVDAPHPSQSDLQAAMLRTQQRAERSDSAFWRRYRFRDRADFFRHFQRLSEVIMRESQEQAGQPSVAWINPQAKYPLPSKVRTALYRSHRV